MGKARLCSHLTYVAHTAQHGFGVTGTTKAEQKIQNMVGHHIALCRSLEALLKNAEIEQTAWRGMSVGDILARINKQVSQGSFRECITHGLYRRGIYQNWMLMKCGQWDRETSRYKQCKPSPKRKRGKRAPKRRCYASIINPKLRVNGEPLFKGCGSDACGADNSVTF